MTRDSDGNPKGQDAVERLGAEHDSAGRKASPNLNGPSSPVEAVEVTQADRDAAAAASHEYAMNALGGKGRGHEILVEAFARHRLTSLPTRDAAIEEAAKVAFETLYPSNPESDWTQYACDKARHARVVRDAIRTLSTPTSGEASAPPPLSEDERAAFIRLLDAADRYNGVHSHSKQPMARMQGDLILAVRNAYRVLGIDRTGKQTSPTPAESGAGAREDVERAREAAEAWRVPDDKFPGETYKPKDDCVWGFEQGYLAALASSPTEQMREAFVRTFWTWGPGRGTEMTFDEAPTSQRDRCNHAADAFLITLGRQALESK